MELDCKVCETLTIDCAYWKHLITNGVASFESYRVARAVVQRTCRKGDFLPNVEPRTRSCVVSGGYLLSNAVLAYHMRTHGNWTSTTVPVVTLLLLGHENLSRTCPVCRKVFKSAEGVKKHFKILGTTAPVNDKQEFDCHLCHKKRHSRAGLKSHLRVHEHNTIKYKQEYYYSGINPVEFRGHSKCLIIKIIVNN